MTAVRHLSQRFETANLRKTVLDMAFAGSTVHIGCAFSLIEILAVLYRHHLHYPGNDPKSPGRDFMVLSKGHGVMAQYACMHELGWLKDEAIDRYFSDGSELKGLSDSRVDGLEVTSGSLGHGFSVGVGIAYGLKLRGLQQKVFVIVGDGEINEGPIWEGMLFAAHHRLDNFMVIVDQNGFQAMGSTEEVLQLGNVQEKFASFDFSTAAVDGHDELALDQAIQTLWQTKPGMPKALIAKTIKGKGVSFMEHDNRWHYTRLTKDTYEQALREVKKG
jgi:transketolase